LPPVSIPLADSSSEFGLTQQQLFIAEIFMPYALREMRRVHDHSRNFVYYCAASTAVSLIQREEIWLRNAIEMNDFQEIKYGIDCLNYALDASKDSFDRVLHTHFPNFFEELIIHFKLKIPQLENASFLCSVSEHLPHEDQMGRLSMWRAYGRENGVALVLSSKPFLTSQANFGAFSSPVAYFKQEEVHSHLEEILSKIHVAIENVKLLPRQELLVLFSHILEMAALSTKHPGFTEEKEWRIFYRPTLDQVHIAKSQVEVIGSIPQRVYKLSLKDRKHEGVVGFTLHENLKRIIIGPTDHGFVIKDAIASALLDIGISDFLPNIVFSGIPLRSK
jgi:hypothetical protein